MENKTKLCSLCKQNKDLDAFPKHKETKDGRNTYCKECDKIRKHNYYVLNKDKVRQKNRDYLSIPENAIKSKKANKINRGLNKDKSKIYHKGYYLDNKESIKSRTKNYYKNNTDKCLLYSKKYYQENREEFIRKQCLRDKVRKKSEPLFKLKSSIRSNINRAIKRKNFVKKSRTQQILGCSYKEFKLYIEDKFEPWMNWDNHGLYNGKQNYGWDLDHITPIDTAQTEEEVVDLNHYTNFQPLCSYTNRVIKRNKK